MIDLYSTVLFPTIIYHTKINNLDKDIFTEIIKEQEFDPAGRFISNCLGWQSQSFNNTDNHPATGKFVNETLLPAIYEAYQTVNIKNQCRLGNYWFNVNRKFSYNIDHNHANSLMSAVLYLKVPTNSGKIVFNRPDKLIDYWNIIEPNEYNQLLHDIEPEENMLIIFPSYLLHRVNQNLTDDADDRRVSIAFNFR